MHLAPARVEAPGSSRKLYDLIAPRTRARREAIWQRLPDKPQGRAGETQTSRRREARPRDSTLTSSFCDRITPSRRDDATSPEMDRMAVDAESLIIRLEAQSEQLRREMRRAQQSVNTGSKRM